MADRDVIERVVIHPTIGIARVGNSPNEFFYGPEVPGPHPRDPDGFRDSHGRIKRQAARFRLFGLNADGEVVREITAKDADITWRVHVANKKAAWYRFDQAFDIPASKGERSGVRGLASTGRNVQIQGAERSQLVIDPGPRIICRTNVNPNGDDARYAFDTGTFFGKPVYLGELRTDGDGNLTFLGGRGHSESKDGQPPVGFANSPWWHDDVSDGPVDAIVRLGDREFTATGAWVVVGPPNYAPGVPAIVTGYDLVFEVATKLAPDLKPPRPSFSEHIYPLLIRFAQNQWVNAGFARDFGWGTLNDFTRPETIARLNDPASASRPLRHAIFRRFRNPDYEVLQTNAWPDFYGDAVELDPTTTDPREWMAVLDIQYEWLRKWAEGDFESDWAPPAASPWEDMTPGERATALDVAALEETTGGPFHPGCEFTWPLRLPILYDAPFRVKRRAAPPPDWGAELTSSIALKVGGPLDGSDAGDITRWMACPWQTDTASCLSAYRQYSGEYLPTFWPARVPNDVLTDEGYRVVVDRDRPVAERQAAFDFAQRKKWLRGIVYKDTDAHPPQIIRQPQPTAVFIEQWHTIGIVTAQPAVQNESLFPDQFWVETGRTVGAEVESAEPAETESLWEHNPTRHR